MRESSSSGFGGKTLPGRQEGLGVAKAPCLALRFGSNINSSNSPAAIKTLESQSINKP